MENGLSLELGPEDEVDSEEHELVLLTQLSLPLVVKRDAGGEVGILLQSGVGGPTDEACETTSLSWTR